MAFKSFTDVNSFLEQRRKVKGMDFSLGRIEKAIQLLEHPEKNLKIIHFAGSNGKGSTIHYCKNILEAQGFTIGLFTSPAFELPNDQIYLSGEPISEQIFLEYSNALFPIMKQMEEQGQFLTEFEILTLIALVCFANADKLDFVLLETGLGGRLDSTNIVFPILSVITTISLEHTAILGDTIEEIAREKAGIIKPKMPVVVGNISESARNVILARATVTQSQVFLYGRDFYSARTEECKHGESFIFANQMSETELNLSIPMNGSHQVDNASVAVMAMLTLRDNYEYLITKEAIDRGLRTTYWPGRFELISSKPIVIIDGAHNPAGIRATLRTVTDKYPSKKVRVLFSALKDKDFRRMITYLEEVADQIIFTEIVHERAAHAEDLSKCGQKLTNIVERNSSLACERALNMLQEDEILLVTGSLYFIRDIRPVLVKILGIK